MRERGKEGDLFHVMKDCSFVPNLFPIRSQPVPKTKQSGKPSNHEPLPPLDRGDFRLFPRSQEKLTPTPHKFTSSTPPLSLFTDLTCFEKAAS